MKGPGRFLSRENLIHAGWALLLAGVGFLGGRAVGWFTGPDRVIITALPNPPAQVSARLSDEERQAIFDLVSELRSLRTDLGRQLQESRAQTRQAQANVSTLADGVRELTERVAEALEAQNSRGDSERLARLAEEVRQLREEAKRQQTQLKGEDRQAAEATNRLAGTLDSLVGVLEARAAVPIRSREANPIAKPPFSIPTAVKGYQPVAVAKLVTPSCPPTQLSSGAPLQFTFIIRDASLIREATPFFFRAIRLQPDGSPQLQVFEQQYAMRLGTNILDPEISLRPGDYSLSYGYYLRDELGQEFPKYYSQECRVQITAKK